MKKLEFNIYIGRDMLKGQGDDIVAVIDLPTIVPKGQYTANGQCYNNSIGFPFLHLLGDYITDWIDFLEDEDLIKAKVHLNKYTERKTFKGKEIVKVIDIIAKENNRTFAGSLNSILEELK